MNWYLENCRFIRSPTFGSGIFIDTLSQWMGEPIFSVDPPRMHYCVLILYLQGIKSVEMLLLVTNEMQVIVGS